MWKVEFGLKVLVFYFLSIFLIASLQKVALALILKNMLTRRKESDTYLATVSRHCWSRQITMKIADESHSAGWKLQQFIYYHRDLPTPAMSTDSSQVGVVHFPSC